MTKHIAAAALLSSLLLAAPQQGAQQGPRRPAMPAYPDGATDIWNIDTNHTSAQFAVKHMLVSTVRGALGPVVGWIRWDGKSASSIAVHAVIDVTNINSGAQGRDRDLRSDNFLLVEQYPDITFISKRVTGITPVGFKLLGDLTIRGVTKEVTLDVEGPSKPVQRAVNAPPVVGATATTTINRKDFGVKYNALLEAGGAVVSEDVKIQIDIEARKR